MRKFVTTLLLFFLTLLSVGAAVVLFIDGSLARLTGWYHFRPGMSLFPKENLSRLQDVSWIRIRDLHDTIECTREKDGSWWIEAPFHDRMAPAAARAIIDFTATAKLIDTLPLNNTTRGGMREFGVETTPHTITLKISADDEEMSTVARYTLGSSSPWLADAGDGKHLLPTTYLRTDFYGRDKRIHVVSGDILVLFKNGLGGLRDPHPLQFEESSLLRIELQQPSNKKESAFPPLVLERASGQSPWIIQSPCLTEADQDSVDSLVTNLSKLRAVRIHDASDISLPEEPDKILTLSFEGGKSVVFKLYPAFTSSKDGRSLCYATVNDRPVVFTLAIEPRLRRQGNGFAEIVNTMLSLPVLPKAQRVRIREAQQWVYLKELPLSLSQLRSRQFTPITAADIDKLILFSRFDRFPLRLRRIPGDSEGQVKDVWMFSAEGLPFAEADPETVDSFLNSLHSIPIEDVVEDIPPTADITKVREKYGLNLPDYELLMQPRECAIRAVLFGLDMPLVRDRAPRSFSLKRQRTGNERYWVGMENDSLTICRLSTKLTKLFSTSALHWKKRTLMNFPISALRTLTLNYQKAPLVLHYDYIGEAWTGTLGGQDITPRINPPRTNFYVRHLQTLRVRQWLRSDNEWALAALQKPVFTVKLELEITDYSALEQLVLDTPLEESRADSADGSTSRMQIVRDMLSEKTEVDTTFRALALGEKKVERKTITIDVAPANTVSRKPLFYGRIREDGSLFILSYDDAQGLDGQLLDK